MLAVGTILAVTPSPRGRKARGVLVTPLPPALSQGGCWIGHRPLAPCQRRTGPPRHSFASIHPFRGLHPSPAGTIYVLLARPVGIHTGSVLPVAISAEREREVSVMAADGEADPGQSHLQPFLAL